MRQGLLLTLAALVLAAPAAASPKPAPAKHTAKVAGAHAGHQPRRETKRTLVASRTDFSGTAVGTIAALYPTWIAVKTERGEVTCARSDRSPALGDRYRPGDKVKFACTDGVLTAIAKLEAPAEVQTGLGTLTSLTATSLTVHAETRDLTCAVTDRSPRLAEFHLGDKVKIACTNGVLIAIAKVDAPPPPPEVKTGLGTITTLSNTALTVHTDAGDLTCRLGDGSPRLGDFHLGDRVKVACTNGVLTAIQRLQ